MADFPWLTALIVAPAFGALALWLIRPLRSVARPLALAWSGIVLACGIAATVAFQSADGAIRLTEYASWIPRFGISYAVGVGGLGLLMILLVSLLVPLVLLAGWREQTTPARQAHYAALVLATQSLVVTVFAARDIALFYIAFEAMLIPVYFLIGSFGGERRRAAALKFLIYSLAGGLAMLAGLVGLWAAGPGGPTAFMIDHAAGVPLSQTAERLIFLSFFVAFAVKAPLFPVHTWLPDAAQAAKPGTSVLLVGVLDKAGTFGMVALCLPLFPRAAEWAAPGIAVLAVISILWGAALALAQKDIMRMIAYTSVSHFGFIVLGIFAFNQTAEVGSAFYMINHGLATGALFLLAGMLIQRRGTAQIDQMGPGLQRTTPVLAGLFLVVGLAVLSLPGMSTFVSEFMVIVGAFQANPAAAIVGATGVILAALYILMAYQKIFTGPPRADLSDTPDLAGRELWAVGPLVALLLVLGFYPGPALETLSEGAAAAVSAVTSPTTAVEVVGEGAIEIEPIGEGEPAIEGEPPGEGEPAGVPAGSEEGSQP
ncbi:MAG: NADH-quinone oxidoreductase subunit M [Bifidobacteriaceae bacterium]|jgi:NADH-quinone oxidoreductase subunit M|nr:NADH-quinone oxidoreductase subunit M [Bifidobacteriaceae bacterium]